MKTLFAAFNPELLLILQQEVVQKSEGDGSWLGIVVIGLLVAIIITLAALPPGRMWFRIVATGISIWPWQTYIESFRGTDVVLITDLFIRARKSGVKVGFFELADLQHAQVDVKEITESLILAHNAQLSTEIDILKEHYLAGGNVRKVVKGLIAAKNADNKLSEAEKLKLTFHTIASIDLAGVDVEQAIDDYVHPKVVETGDITAVAKDGVEITAQVRITIKTDLHRIVSGADSETIKSRINEAVVSAIGEKESHKKILESTYELGEQVIRQTDLWEDGAYNVLSVDIINLKVGKDVGSELRASQAESEMTIQRAKEQEMKTLAAEANVQRIKAESEVQQAMADAFRDGHLSVNDYYNMQNKEADTMMRRAFSKEPHKDEKQFEEAEEEDDDEKKESSYRQGNENESSEENTNE